MEDTNLSFGTGSPRTVTDCSSVGFVELLDKSQPTHPSLFIVIGPWSCSQIPGPDPIRNLPGPDPLCCPSASPWLGVQAQHCSLPSVSLALLCFSRCPFIVTPVAVRSMPGEASTAAWFMQDTAGDSPGAPTDRRTGGEVKQRCSTPDSLMVRLSGLSKKGGGGPWLGENLGRRDEVSHGTEIWERQQDVAMYGAMGCAAHALRRPLCCSRFAPQRPRQRSGHRSQTASTTDSA